ncbi:SGNH hydrolase-type esterase domain-containing protein [Apodospora peruviana]|uniref:SGNH hydrolase-type esterase domain-containing protein n=1 Tax=Apodospora peruviana TaxID=516989 RepID=A0AAE0LZW9_9PEZI|nr:SGNH hydrolase-type esterase domain-containing protein [Apodospora peruviana]
MLSSDEHHYTNHAHPIKFMIIGDSISHGREGDWTWRYRIWEWFRHEGIHTASFVGPYRGTWHPPGEPSEPLARPPPELLLEGEDPSPKPTLLRTEGGYAPGVSPEFLFSDHHAAAWGLQAMQAKDLIAEQIADYQPDVCLVGLGFNDLAWGVSNAEGTLRSIKTFLSQARSKKPDCKFAVANVPHRDHSDTRLADMADEYNKMLAEAVCEWSTEVSPVALVYLAEVYEPDRASYDGIHPNALGEYLVALAFSRTLIRAFSIGRHELRIPKCSLGAEHKVETRLVDRLCLETDAGLEVYLDFCDGGSGD